MKQCTIFGIPVEVYEHPDIMGSETIHMGRADTSQCRIWINSELREDVKMKTLVHEWLHLVSDDLALGLSETQTTALATVLYAEGFNPFKEAPDGSKNIRNKRAAATARIQR